MKQLRPAIRKIARPRSRERGQILIIFALLIAPITFAVGIVAVDASAWVSERRGAQKDADLAALAGAIELAMDGTADAAETAAAAAASTNDEAGNGADDVANIVEIVWHLRDEAGARQVENSKVGLAHVIGLGSACTINILKR